MRLQTPTSTREVLIKQLRGFYSQPENFETLKGLVTGKAAISLRLLDHFVYNYSRVNGVAYPLPNRQLPFVVYESYKQNLRISGKVLFDAFGRHERASLELKGDVLVTSAGQARPATCFYLQGMLGDLWCAPTAGKPGAVGHPERGAGIHPGKRGQGEGGPAGDLPRKETVEGV